MKAAEGGAWDHTPVVLAHEQPFLIGRAEIRPATREIVADGASEVIEPRVMQLLVALHRAAGAVVSKDDLAKLCWEGRIVGEDAINRVVSRLRAVAEKCAHGAFRVETITKVGYRLIAVDEAGVRDPFASRRSSAKVSRRELIVGGSIGAAALVAGAGAYFLRSRDRMPPEARQLYNDARTGFAQGTPEATSNSIAKLKRAAEIAPNSAEVWGLLAVMYMAQAEVAPGATRASFHARGQSAVQRALALDPDQGDALAAQVKSVPMYRNWVNFERACRAALRRQPENPFLNGLLMTLFTQVGRHREALERFELASRSAPDGPWQYWTKGILLWSVGRFDEADSTLTRGMALWPRHYAVWFGYLYYLLYNGRSAQAAALIEDETNRPTAIPDWNYDWLDQQARSVASANQNAIKAAVSLSADLARRGTGFAGDAAVFASFVGDRDTAFRMLDALYFNRGFAMPDAYFAKEQGLYTAHNRDTYLLFEPPMAALRKDPRFAQLTRELGLDEYWRRTNSRTLVNP